MIDDGSTPSRSAFRRAAMYIMSACIYSFIWLSFPFGGCCAFDPVRLFLGFDLAFSSVALAFPEPDPSSLSLPSPSPLILPLSSLSPWLSGSR